MGVFKAVAELIILYILFRIAVNFIIPTYKNFVRFKKQFDGMKNPPGNQQTGGPAQPRNFQSQKDNEKVPARDDGEYIDFEEVKD